MVVTHSLRKSFFFFLSYLPEPWHLFFIYAQTVQSKTASTSEILHFIGCEKWCVLDSEFKYYPQNKIFLHLSLVKCWQLWTLIDNL